MLIYKHDGGEDYKNYCIFNPHMITDFSGLWTSVSWVRRTQLQEKKEKISLMAVAAVHSKVTAHYTFFGSM